MINDDGREIAGTALVAAEGGELKIVLRFVVFVSLLAVKSS